MNNHTPSASDDTRHRSAQLCKDPHEVSQRRKGRSMTIIITKTKLALGILAMVLVGATVVAAGDGVFTDNPSGTYYHDPVEWAYDNGITTGTSATTFSPMDSVTRGQNVTFAYRYDTNVVQPALEALQTVVGVATVKADGSVVAARSSGVTDTNVSLDSASAFCFSLQSGQNQSVVGGFLSGGYRHLRWNAFGHPSQQSSEPPRLQ